MGFREKFASAMVAVITTQIVCSVCMPRGLPNCSVKSHLSSLSSPKSVTSSIREFKTNRKLKKSSYNNVITGNSSKVSHLPNLQKPRDCEAGSCFRFNCDYPHESKKLNKPQFQTRNFKREANQNHYLDLDPRDMGQLPVMSSGLANEPPLQPYCFRKSSFFPEVEYPLSARDMWIPKYWSRLQDAEVPRKIKIDAPVCEKEEKKIKSIYSSYENSPLYGIIKTLNNHNKSDSGKIDYSNLREFVPKKSENESKHDGIFSYRNSHSTATVLPEYTTPSKYTISDIHSEVLPCTKTTTEAYPVLEEATVSSIEPPITSAITMENFFTLPYTTTPMEPNIPTSILSVTSSNFRNSDFDVIDVTTPLPFEDFTSPISQSIAPADKFISLPTTFASVQAQERDTSLSETNTELTTTPELVSFIPSTEQKPDQELRAHTTPMQLFLSSTIENKPDEKLRDSTTSIQFTTLPSMKSSDIILSDFDEIAASTASRSDLFTSAMTHSEAMMDNTTSHTQMEKIPMPTTLSTVTSVAYKEEELRLTESNTKPTNTSPLLYFSSTIENKPEEELSDYTTPMQFTTLPSIKSSDRIQSDFDKIAFSTASPSNLFTSPMSQSEAMMDNTISHTQMEKIPTATTLSTITSVTNKEEELLLNETNTKPTTTSPLLSFSSTIENKPEEKLIDSTTSMQFTTLPSMKSSDKIQSDFDNIAVSTALPSDLFTSPKRHSEALTENTVSHTQMEIIPTRLTTVKSPRDEEGELTDSISPIGNSLPSSNLTFENTHIVNNTSIPLSQLDTFQGQVVGYYYENTTNDDILQLCTSHRSNYSIIFTDDCKENWVYSSNDSYITWESIPECSNECFLFIDTENPSSATVCNDNNLNVSSIPELLLMTESKYSGDVTKNVTTISDIPANIVALEKFKSEETPKIDLTENTEVQTGQNPQLTGIIKYPADNGLRVLGNNGTIANSVSVVDNANSTVVKLPLFPEYLNDFISNIVYTTKNEDKNELQSMVNYLMQESNIDEIILFADSNTVNMNSTSDNIYVDVDEAWASYTEIPYDALVLNLDVNDTSTANGDEYILYEQMVPEDSVDTTQFFLDTEKSSGFLDEIIMHIS